MKLITDTIASRKGENIVMISKLKDITDFSIIDLEDTYIAKLESDKLTKETVEK